MMEKAESAQERGLSAAGMSETAAAHGEAAEAVRREKKARRRPDDGTEFCGVRRTPSGKYQAQIWDRSRRTVCLGTFGTAEEAAGAFDAAVVRLRGAAKTNSKIPAAVQPSASVTVVTAESAGHCEIAEEHGGGVEAVERRGKKALPEEYYERTKDSPAGRNDGKTCRFFQQVEVLHGPAGTASLVAPPVGATAGLVTPVVGGNLSFSTPNTQADQDSDDEGTDDMGEQGKRKRTPEGGAADGEGPMKQEMEWQEAMQRWFVEAIEKREQDRMIREEAWRRQEMARLAREQEILAQERAMVATRNATVLSFIPMPSIDELPIRFMPPPAPSSQTLAMPTAYAIAPPPSSQTLATPTAYAAAPLPSSQTHALPIPYATPIAYAAAPPPTSQPPATTQPQEPPTMPPASGSGGGGGAAWSLPWSRAEVHALIQLRNNLDMRRKGPKVSLWDDISAGMRRLGYIRSSKRCMQKWRRMNEYFRKMKESNKKRPEVSKKCPFYFHQLEALSRNKAALGSPAGAGGAAAEHANAAPQDRIEASSGQNIRFMPPPPPPSQSHATTIAYAAAPQKPTLVVHQISTDIVMTPAETAHDASGSGGGGGAASSSLWSKEEVHALIQLRWNLYTRRKRVSWEEISADMRRMGYSRSSKRCMQKWENMNSYFKNFKKTMERNEKRPDDSKTYPSYFHQLEALYRDKAALGYPAGAGGAANAAPQDHVEAFTVTAPISQKAPPLYILPPVAKNGVTREMDFTHAVA